MPKCRNMWQPLQFGSPERRDDEVLDNLIDGPPMLAAIVADGRS